MLVGFGSRKYCGYALLVVWIYSLSAKGSSLC